MKDPIKEKERRRRYYELNKERIKEKQRLYNKTAKEKISENKKSYYLKNKEELSLKKKKHYQNRRHHYILKAIEYEKINIDRIKIQKALYYKTNKNSFREKHRDWCKDNKHIIRSIRAKRRACKKQATPKWLTSEHYNQIKEIYKEATRLEKLDGIKRHVDHIIPLNNEYICGLHVPWNLQVLTASENCSKSNKLLDNID